jgi:hypothetical protein
MRLLARVTRTQRWGIPAAAGRAWRVWFKGGWRPGGHEQTSGPVAHQGALVERGQVRLGLAVLTEGEPGYGFETIEQIASRLLNPAPPGDLRRWPSA